MSKKLNKKKLNKIIHQNSSINMKEYTEPFKLSIEPYTEDIPYDDEDTDFVMLYKAYTSEFNGMKIGNKISEEDAVKKINGIRTYMLFFIEDMLSTPDIPDNNDIPYIENWFDSAKELLDISSRPFIRMNEVTQEMIGKDGTPLNQKTDFKMRLAASSYGCSINEFLIVRCISSIIYNAIRESIKTSKFNFKENKVLLYILLELLKKPERLSDKNAIKSINCTVTSSSRLVDWKVVFYSNKKPNFFSRKYPDINWNVDDNFFNIHDFHEIYSLTYPHFREDSINSLITLSETTSFFNTKDQGKEWLSFAPILQGVVTPIETELKRIIAYNTGVLPKNILFSDAINEGHKLGVLTKEQKKAFHLIRKFRNKAIHSGKLTEDEYKEIQNIIMKEKILHMLHDYIKLNKIP